jgi:thiol reductant ABC exporter CydC subunit
MKIEKSMSSNIRMMLAMVLGSSAIIGGIGLTISSAWLITMASEQPPILVLMVSIVMVRFFGIFRSVARYAERVISHESVFRTLTSLRVALFEKLAGRNLNLVRDSGSGKYVKSIVDDVERAQEFQLRVTLPRYAALISISFALLLAFWIFPPTLLLLLPISLALLFAIPSVVSRRCLELSEQIENSENRYAQAISDASYGAVEARIYGYSHKISENLASLEERIFSEEGELLRLIRKLQAVTVLLLGSSIFGTVFILLYHQDFADLPAVKISMAIFLPLVAFEGITTWFPNLFISGKLLRAQRTINEIMEFPTMDFPELESEIAQSEAFDGSLILSDVGVAWDKDFMSPVSTSVLPGQLLVIRGKSGSGKSTLAMGLTGLLPYSGSVHAGGVELSKISDISKVLVSSLQRTHIFNTSLRENLLIANSELADDEIKRMLALLEIDDIPLDTTLGEFGRPLSGGEAKRLSVARALLSPARILILDEPTEHLDAALASRIEDRIRHECREKTLIVITHSGWLKSDRTVDIERE